MKDRSIRKNAILNIVKKCVNIVIPLIIYPYVSRVLGAQTYGKYAFAESVMGYIALISGFGISTYAIREIAKVRDDRSRAAQFSAEIFTINLVTMLIALTVLGTMLLLVPRLHETRSLFGIMAVDVLFSTFSRDWLTEAYEDYTYITMRYLFFQILSAIAILLFVRTPNDVVIYACLRCAATVGGYMVSILYTRKYAPICLCTLKRLRGHWKPLFVFFGCSCASAIYIHSDVTILGFFKNDTDVGIYSIVSKIYTLVKSFVNAIVLVMIPRVSYYVGNHKEKHYADLIRSAENILTMIILPAAVGVWCLSGDLIMALAGEEYTAGAGALKILAVSLIFAVFSYLYAYGCLIPNGMDQYFFKASIASAVLNILGNLILIPLFGIDAAAMTTLLAEIIMYWMTSRYAGKTRLVKHRGSLFMTAISLIECSIIYVQSLFIKQCSFHSVIRIILLFIGSVISYLVLLAVGCVMRRNRA